jgi:lysophospholipase
MGHSMGGHLVLRARLEGVVDPDAMVLSAPMLGFETGLLPVSWVAALVGLLAKLRPNRKAWGSNERPAPARALRQPFLTHDDDRYADETWWQGHRPELVMGPPSLLWLAAAYRSTQWTRNVSRLATIKTPIQIIGTDDDKLVSPQAIHDFARRLPNARLHMFGEGVAHEVLREVDTVRDEALDIIDAFLDEVVSRP